MAGILRGAVLLDRSVAGIKLMDGTVGTVQLMNASVTMAKLAQDVIDYIDNIGTITVEDTLTSTSTVNALSANQGRALKALIDSIAIPSVLDSLTSTSTTAALSANQGRVLKGQVDGKQATLVSGTNIKTINNTTILGSGNIAVQPVLVSGTSIKTINGESVLGAGDIVISGGSTTTVLDTLTSSSATDALSANQGRVLKALIDAITVPSVIDNLTSTSTTNALSANQGRALKTLVDGKQATLVSGTNIKTIAGNTILGTGDLSLVSLGAAPASHSHANLAVQVQGVTRGNYDTSSAQTINITRDQLNVFSKSEVITEIETRVVENPNMMLVPVEAITSVTPTGITFSMVGNRDVYAEMDIVNNKKLEEVSASRAIACGTQCRLFIRNSGTSECIVDISDVQPRNKSFQDDITIPVGGFAEVIIMGYGLNRVTTTLTTEIPAPPETTTYHISVDPQQDNITYEAQPVQFDVTSYSLTGGVRTPVLPTITNLPTWASITNIGAPSAQGVYPVEIAVTASTEEYTRVANLIIDNGHVTGAFSLSQAGAPVTTYHLSFDPSAAAVGDFLTTATVDVTSYSELNGVRTPLEPIVQTATLPSWLASTGLTYVSGETYQWTFESQQNNLTGSIRNANVGIGHQSIYGVHTTYNVLQPPTSGDLFDRHITFNFYVTHPEQAPVYLFKNEPTLSPDQYLTTMMVPPVGTPVVLFWNSSEGFRINSGGSSTFTELVQPDTLILPYILENNSFVQMPIFVLENNSQIVQI